MYTDGVSGSVVFQHEQIEETITNTNSEQYDQYHGPSALMLQ